MNLDNQALWVLTGLVMPVGAREIIAMGPAPIGMTWVDICMLGQHLPQMYRLDEIHDLQAEDCHDLGLCAACMGYGTLAAEILPATTLDELPDPCETCGGSGRPGVRVHIRKFPGTTEARIVAQPHDYVPWAAMGPDYCIACGTRPGEFADGKCRRG